MDTGIVVSNEQCTFIQNRNLELIDKKSEKEIIIIEEIEIFRVIY